MKEYEKFMHEQRVKRHALKLECENCTLCPNLVWSRALAPYKKATHGYGNPDSSVMFVGEAPGLHGCATTGIPFTKDRSGKLYQWVLEYLGVNLRDVYTTNIVKCWPKDPHKMKNRTPTDTEVRNCLPHLLKEIELVKPRWIVCLGRVPERILRESLPSVDANMIRYIPHPAYALRKGTQPGNRKAELYAEQYRKYIPGAVDRVKQAKLAPEPAKRSELKSRW